MNTDVQARTAQVPDDTRRYFDVESLDGLPAPAAAFLRHSIAPGTSLPARVRLLMHGYIKIVGIWLPFRAEQTIEGGLGFSWTATIAGGLISGGDSYDGELGQTHFAIGGTIPIVSGSGPDVTRSAIGRFVAEQTVWLPGSLLPASGTHWSASDAGHAAANVPVAGGYTRLGLGIGADGAVRDVSMMRWGPSHGHFARLPFGMRAEAETTFGGFTVVSRGRVGWWYGTRRWPSGEFFRFTIDDLRPC